MSAVATVLAFDFGERFVGVAVGDTETGHAHPLTTIDSRANETRFAAIGSLIDEWRPALAVVGLPLNDDGSAHAQTLNAERFARRIEGRFKLPVALVDERFTSAAAESALAEIGHGGRKNKGDVHPVAAQLILRAYFDDPSSRR